MTRDDIIRMAQEADLGVYLAPQWQLYEQLERFFHAAYAAGAADEREACAQLCERMARRTEDIRRAALEVAAENIRARGNT